MEQRKSRVRVLPPIPRNFSFRNLRKLEVAGLSPEQECPTCSSTQPPPMEQERPTCSSTRPPPMEQERPTYSSTRPPPMEQERPTYSSTQPPPMEQERPTYSSTRSPPMEPPQLDRSVFPAEAAQVASPPSPQLPTPSAPTYAPIITPAVGHSIAPAMVPAFPFLHGHRQQTHHGSSVPAKHTHMGIGIPVIPDPRFGTDKIMGLNLYNFHNFTMAKEKALILFYNPKTSSTCGIKQQFELAAEKYQDQNRAFGAVDCFLDKELCCRENICSTPMFKLYSNGFPVSSVSDTSKFNAYQMHLLIKMTPVFAQPRNVISKQPARPRVIMGTRMLRRQSYGV